MKKCLTVLSILIIVTSGFVACNNGAIHKMDAPSKFVQEYIIDNSTPLSSLLKNTYELQELLDYFGQIPPNENTMYDSTDNGEHLLINNVNSRFPVECVRQNGDLSYYSVYKVSEGGYFYVFWSRTVDSLRASESKQPLDNAAAYFTVYISTLRNASDFNSIKPRVSTAEDVAQIDPAFELSFLMSSGPRSFSLLDDYTVLEVRYKHSSNVTSRKDLLVESVSILQKEAALSASYLASISLDDLP